MEKISRYFTDEEFRCPCGRPDCDALKTPHPELLHRLDVLRFILHRPVVITSGLRCPLWNYTVGGAEPSAHVTGEAADIQVLGSVERYAVLSTVLPLFTRIGIGSTFIHLDVSPSHDQHVAWLYPSPEADGASVKE